MRNRKKTIIASIILLVMLMVGISTNAAGIKKKVEIIFNSVSLRINGKAISGENILYQGNVYARVDNIAKAMDKYFLWDKKKSIINVNDKIKNEVNLSDARMKELEAEVAKLKQIVTDLSPAPTITEKHDGKIIKISANPSVGFNYSYYVFIPKDVEKSSKKKLMVEGNNTGIAGDTDAEVITLERMEGSGGYQLATKLKIPLLTPCFPRPGYGPNAFVYTHDLNRRTLMIPSNDKLSRIDLQLVAMINDSKKILSEYGIEIEDKVFMYGYSASSHFGNRFALLHPEMVSAVATGGINSLPIYPVSEWSGKRLRYPIGVADFRDITKSDFNIEAYKKVPQYIFMGDQDTNDTAPASDCFDPEDTQLIYNLVGQKMVPDRFEKSKEILQQLGIPAQFVLYKNVGHWGLHGKIMDDVIEFFNKNSSDNGKLVEIQPHLNPSK